MNIDNDVKKVLDMRLAKGEISSKEYKHLFLQLENKNQQHAAFNLKNSKPILKYKTELLLYNDFLIYNGNKHNYSEIKEVSIKDDEYTVNLISIAPEWWLWITFMQKNKDSIWIKAYSPAIKTPKFYFLKNAYNFLKKKTFKYQLFQIFMELKSERVVQLSKGIMLNTEGIITDGKIKINIIDAKNNGIINYDDIQQSSWISGNRSTYKDIFLIAPSKDTKKEDCIIFQSSNKIIIYNLLYNFKKYKNHYFS